MRALHDGDEIEPWETVMTIEGDYTLFAHLETVYLGVLARRTLISTQRAAGRARRANGKPILFFPARHDHHRVQTGDGYAAHIAGAIGVSTDAQASWWGGRGIGTVPHGLIAAYGGDTVLAARSSSELGRPRRRRRRARRLRERLGATRRSRWRGRSATAALGRPPRHVARRSSTARSGPEMGRLRPARRQPAARPQRARGARREGFRHVRIVVSGGFNVAQDREFEAKGVPVDAYGVGSTLIRGENDFTADVVVLRRRAAPGRRARGYLPNPRLERVAPD